MPRVLCPGLNLNLGGWETYTPLALMTEEGILPAQPQRPDGAQSQDPRLLMAKEAVQLVLPGRPHAAQAETKSLLALSCPAAWAGFTGLATPRYSGSLNTEGPGVAPARTPAWGGVTESYIEHSNKQGPDKLWVHGVIPRPILRYPERYTTPLPTSASLRQTL